MGIRPSVDVGWHTQDTGEQPVDFVIGMRWSQLWRLLVRPWVPLAFAHMVMPAGPGGAISTRLSVTRAGPVVLQRWRSRAALDAWARDSAQPHAPAWRRFRGEATSTASWGLWHEVRRTGRAPWRYADVG